MAVFQGTDQSIFRDRREFTGSLLRQLKEVYGYIDLRNQTRATFDGLRRVDSRDYPEVAVREALLNVLVHREYAFHASALISLYQDRIELISVGGLVPGVDLEDIMMGISLCRNQNLANVFYRLALIEAYGTGIRKIMNSYRGQRKKPSIEVSSHAFKITLPNLNEDTGPDLSNPSPLPLGTQAQVMEWIKETGAVTRADVERICGLSASSAYRLLRRMANQGLLIQQGRGKNTQYIVSNRDME